MIVGSSGTMLLKLTASCCCCATVVVGEVVPSVRIIRGVDLPESSKSGVVYSLSTDVMEAVPVLLVSFELFSLSFSFSFSLSLSLSFLRPNNPPNIEPFFFLSLPSSSVVSFESFDGSFRSFEGGCLLDTVEITEEVVFSIT